ncbi:hypothetical protein IQ26_01814 [Mesorhizobium tianshanense]|uniref:Uncharacterized protein n=1 Tax=Mesorhizobium tianshanense TaxID=39844 RepID=A0A562P553_9HYPH|nr:hypothetical protein IQ26_01814 [Mesorhizobium tianshanense]
MGQASPNSLQRCRPKDLLSPTRFDLRADHERSRPQSMMLLNIVGFRPRLGAFLQGQAMTYGSAMRRM